MRAIRVLRELIRHAESQVSNRPKDRRVLLTAPPLHPFPNFVLGIVLTTREFSSTFREREIIASTVVAPVYRQYTKRLAVSALIFRETGKSRWNCFLPADVKISRRENAGEFTTHRVRMYTRIESSITAVIPRRGRESGDWDQKRRHRPRQQVENTMRAWSHLRPSRVSRIILFLVLLSDSLRRESERIGARSYTPTGRSYGK